MGAHRHGPGPEHDFEPVRGLPAPLPEGERILWQGSPDPGALARRAFHVRKVAIYFAAVGGLQLAVSLADGTPPGEAAAALAVPAALAAGAIGVLAPLGRAAARAAVYTITDRRVVMRIGIVLTITFNLPYARIAAAGLRVHADGTADLPLALARGDAIGWAHLWPHARPWRLRAPEPMLRCVPDGLRVGRLLADAWADATGGAALPVSAPARPRDAIAVPPQTVAGGASLGAARAVGGPTGDAQGALAGR
jgi:hypothetical protein